jgi:DNA segregation ATPase FtsK/SpoIIIE-like protein
MVRFSTNPILFKIIDINHDYFDSTRSITTIIGQAFHTGMEVYNGGSDTVVPNNESEAIEVGIKAAMDYMEKYPEGFLKYTTTVPNKQKAFDLLAFAFNSYVKEFPYQPDKLVSCEEKIVELIDVEWRGEKLTLPVKLKGKLDKIEREDGELVITDYKTCSAYSDPEKIDGAKMLQAVEYYFLVHAKYGEAPTKMRYQEVKMTQNRDGSKQVKTYEVVYAENESFFDFYFRYYADVIRALNGEQVFVPNVHAIFDNEVAIIAYIHHLDIAEEKAELMKKHKVDNITDLLKRELHSASNMNKLLKAMEKQFVEAKSINYSTMSNEEKIKTKLMEHGMVLQFDSVVNGASVDLYRFTPSIGIKMSRLKGYVADIEQVLGSSGIRVLAPIPDTSFVGFEVPKKERSFPSLADSTGGFDIAIGETVMGEVRRFDIRTAPHLLVAGATGSGKSVFLSSLISQLSKVSEPCEIHLFDPKHVELVMHANDANVVEHETDIMEIHDSLESLVSLMNKRYKELAKAGVRGIQDYKGNMPYKFVVIDEFGDLIMQKYVDVKVVKTGHVFQKGERAGEEETRTVETQVSKEISDFILLLAQKARAAGIHIIIATQRPSVDIITGSIKANFPTKVAFRTAKAIDSQVLIDTDGAEKLLGKGDMLFASDRGMERLQGYKN